MAQSDDLTGIIFNPGKAGELGIQSVQQAQADQGGGVKSGIPVIDAELLPLRAGKLMTVWGYTSHWKSHFMDWYAMQEARQIMERAKTNPDLNEVIIKVTWEDSVEEDTLNLVAASSQIPISRMFRGTLTSVEWELLNKAAIARQTTPLWMIGHSLIESRKQRLARPRLDLTDVWNAVDLIVNKISGPHADPTLLIMDYLQRMPRDRADRAGERRESVSWNINKCKDMAIAFGCAALVGIQAARRVLDHEEAMPTLQDALESSAIEQTSDVAMGLWYPFKTMPGGSVDGVAVTPRLLVAALLKQKFGKAPLQWILDIDPAQGLIQSARPRSVSPIQTGRKKVHSEDD